MTCGSGLAQTGVARQSAERETSPADGLLSAGGSHTAKRIHFYTAHRTHPWFDYS